MCFCECNSHRSFLCCSGEVPDIEEILLSNLNEIENTSDGGDLQQHPKVQEFAQQVWNIHHSGQPLPNSATNNGRDEDIIIAQVCLLGHVYGISHTCSKLLGKQKNSNITKMLFSLTDLKNLVQTLPQIPWETFMH